MRHTLPVQGPLDLDLTFSCGQAFRWVRAGGGWSGIVGRAELLVEADPGRVTVAISGEDPGAPAIGHYLRLDQDPLRFLEDAQELSQLPGILPLFGLRLLRQDPWETLASFLCSAASNIPKISRSVEGMAARWGEPLPGSRSSRRAFPAAERLARASDSDLRRTGLGFRAPRLRAAARIVSRRSWSWDALRESTYEEARERLMELPGVGPKIADCTLLFGLDRLEAYPVDRWIRRATLELWSRRKAKDEELARWAVRFGAGRGYLQQILFHLRRTQGPLPALPRAAQKRRTA